MLVLVTFSLNKRLWKSTEVQLVRSKQTVTYLEHVFLNGNNIYESSETQTNSNIACRKLISMLKLCIGKLQIVVITVNTLTLHFIIRTFNDIKRSTGAALRCPYFDHFM